MKRYSGLCIFRHFAPAFAIAISLAEPAYAQEAFVYAPAMEAAATSDSEGFRSLRLRAAGLYRYDNPWRHEGVAVQSARYAQNDFRQSVTSVLGLYRDQQRAALTGIDAEVGVAMVSGHLRPIGDVTLRMTTTLGSAIDFIASADLVETPAALARGVGYTFVATNIEQQLRERWTLVTLAGWQSFSDGNSRPHLRGRLIWLADKQNGITLQMRYRLFSSKQVNVDGAYFNPAQYRQWLGVVAIRKRHEGWTLHGELGFGQEYSSGAGTRASFVGALGAEGALTDHVRLKIRASVSRSAGFIDGPDFAARYFNVTVVAPLK